jgi:formylmethanofuran dehydrogenase subunit A
MVGCRITKAREVIVEQGEIRLDTYGKTLHVAPEYDREAEADISRWFEESYSIQWRNDPVADSYVHDHEVVA